MTTNSFKLPGFGLPLNTLPSTVDQSEDTSGLFPNALNVIYLESSSTPYAVFL